MVQHSAIVNCAAMNIGVHSFFWTGVSGLLTAEPKKELLPFATAWMKLESIMLSDIS